MKKPCVFFDRDGIINRQPSPEEYYVLSPERFFMQAAFLDALRVVVERGWPAVVVTNQKSVHLGLITMAGIRMIHDGMLEQIRAAGLDLLDVYVCPHGDGHPDGKPAPGMLLRAAEEHDLDLSASWMVGDAERDITAGRAAGCAFTLRIDAGEDPTEADHRLRNIDELPAYLSVHLPVLKT